MSTAFKKPVSVLVLIHTPELEILLLERASHPGYWQSVTGSQEEGEDLVETATREVEEETGIVAATEDILDWRLSNRFEIFQEWRFRYAPGVSHNTEHVYSLCIPSAGPVRLAPGEHLSWRWLPWKQAARAVFSWTNRDAILMLGETVSGKR
ncbi:MAG: dihydroneopterin triphosphate diphosphatase [Rhodocyclaceae bacterium]|nr:dihydroneopterin triphosphate diphosphatase [Rhodocyclaceae bacterium]